MDGVLGEFPYRNQPWLTLLPVLQRLTADQLAFRVEGSPSSIGWLVDHNAGVEDFWINEVCFHAPLVQPDDVDERDLAGLIGKRNRVRAKTEHWLSWTSPKELARPIDIPTFPDGWAPLGREEATLRWAIGHVFSHEAYHIGQIVMLLRAQGIPDPLF